VTESLFTTQVPVLHDNSDATTYTLGTYFTPAVDGTITAVRWWFPSTPQPGADPAVKAALFRTSDGAKLTAEPDVAFSVPGDSDQWNEVALATPISVTAASVYCVAVRVPDRYVASSGGSSPWPITNGDLSAATGAGRFRDMNGLPGGAAGQPNTVFPSDSFGNGCYFVDVVFAPTVAGPSEGTIDVGLDLAVAAVGAAAHESAVDVGLNLAVAAVGATRHEGSVALTFDLAVAATGARSSSGAAALGLNLAPSSVGANGTAARVVGPRNITRGPDVTTTSRPGSGRIVTRVQVAD
jgi:hypothetical protein